MKGYCQFIFIYFLLLCSAGAHAQGDVVVHSDPRLSLLLKKNHSEIASSAKMASSAKLSAHKSSDADLHLFRDVAVHPAEGMTAPHPGSMPMQASIAKPPVPVKAQPLVWAPKHHVRTIYEGKGFRVQIYYGSDRAKAMDIKNEFSRSNPGVRTYLSYISPYFRVKVGNYRNRSDAVGMWREANSAYNPSMIVPDIITVTTIY